MDSDCRASPGWLRAGLAALDEGVGIVQGRTLRDDRVPAGIFTHFIEVEAESFLYETANIFYRRSAVLEAGGFPPDPRPHTKWFLGGEDTRLAWKVKRAGWASCFATDALVWHQIRPMPKLLWFFNPHLAVFPLLVKEFPELRRFFYLRYFYDRAQAVCVLAVLALVLALLTPAALVLALPYLWHRASEPTGSLRGPLRVLRPLFYLPRDLVYLGTLVGASLAYRSVML